MLMVVKFELFSHANDTCLVFESRNVMDIDKQPDEYFGDMQWYAANNLSIHIREDETKPIHRALKQKIKKVPKLSIIYNYLNETIFLSHLFLSCILEETISGILWFLR